MNVIAVVRDERRASEGARLPEGEKQQGRRVRRQ